jgi:RNA polymerase sigma factor (sigma-70 family)
MKFFSVFSAQRPLVGEMSDNLQDQQLLRQYLREGSESAFRQLVDRHVDLVYGAAFRQLDNWAPAEEVTQTVFITLARRAAFLTQHPSLAGWLYHTAVNQARQHSRGDQRRRAREDAAAQIGSTMQPDESHALAHVLDEALLELRPDDREALVLRYFENRGLRELGHALGLKEDAAQKRVARALEALTAKFRRRGYAAPAVALTAAMRAVSHAAPAGLAAAVTKAALPFAGAATTSGLVLLFGKFMALTKTQTVIACALIAAAPVAYEWHAATNAHNEHAALQQRLAGLQAQVTEEQQNLTQAQNRLSGTESTLARLRSDTTQRREAAIKARAVAATNYYLWNDASEFVRLPKSQLSRFSLVTVKKKSPLDMSGTEPLMQALGVTPAEAIQSLAAFQTLELDYRQLMQVHAYLTNVAPPGIQVGTNDSLTLVTKPFGDASDVIRDRLRSSLENTLGMERAGAVWQQAEPLFEDQFNDFGTREKYETVYLLPTGVIMYSKKSAAPGEDHMFNYLTMGLGTNASAAAEVFRPFLTAQIKMLAQQRAVARLP